MEVAVPGHPSSQSARRETARALLARHDLDGIARWAASDPQALRTLQPFLYADDALLAWRAVEAVGRAAGAAGTDAARELLRRTLWLMNDESGGVLWRGPEVVGAVLAHVPGVPDDFVALLAGHLDEAPFRVGALWGLWRTACARAAAVAAVAGDVAVSLADTDAAVRGHAALVVRMAGGSAADDRLAALARDPSPLAFFDPRSGALRVTTVADVARGTLGMPP
jgi:hypothetical protein